MIDSEMYPVSFFSQAFDLIQKIQSDFHILEADQVEMFAAQMKKHQALILSIHQQVRNISPDMQTQSPTPLIAKQAPSERPQKPGAIQTENAPPAKTPEQKTKKTSFFNRLGIYKDEESGKVPVKKTVIENAPSRKTFPEKKVLIKGTEESVVNAPTRIIPPASKMTRPAKPAPTETQKPGPAKPAPTETQKPEPAKPAPTETQKPGPAKPAPTETQKPEPASVPVEVNTPQSLNEAIEKKKLSDLRKAFSLNDRFRYRKELFGGSEEAMSKVITILNNKASFKESIAFLEQKLHWDFSDPTVKDFIKILEIRFL
jgi:hypothetical protein